MKLASLKNNSRDGQLIVTNKKITKAVAAPDIAQTLQLAIDNWSETAPKLEEVYTAINDDSKEEINGQKVFDIEFDRLESPLPRAYQWADGSAYVNHVELVRKARGAEMPPNFWTDPLMYQGGSDDFIGPRDNIIVNDEKYGIDFESEIAVITDDVPMNINEADAAKHIKLFMLVNDVSLRALIPAELGKGFGFFHSKPASAFSPVAVTHDELGDSWDGGKINLPLITHYRGELFGKPNAGIDMTFEFPRLVSHAAKTRNLGAGTVIGSGTISNYDRSLGSSCLAEKRMLEILADGKPSTPFMKDGDQIKIEMLDHDGNSIFGSIDQRVVIK